MSNFFKDNFLISNFQSGFRPGMSTTTQLIELYTQFCDAVDTQKEIRVVFLDIHKAFDKVWHKGILYKFYLCGIRGHILNWFKDYLAERKQRVVINGQFSEWGTTQAGVPQGSVLGPLLFLLYIDDFTSAVNFSNIRLFADDTCLFIKVESRDAAADMLESDLSGISSWSDRWLVTFAPEKTKSMVISNTQDRETNPPILFKDVQIEDVKSHTYLGFVFHITNILVKTH